MAEDKLFIDDRVVIPDEIKNMSAEERRAKIRQLEEEAHKERKNIIRHIHKETA